MDKASAEIVSVKNEPQWSSYQSSFACQQSVFAPMQNGMPVMAPAVPGYPEYSQPPTAAVNPPAKRKGRPKIVKQEPDPIGGVTVKQEKITDTAKVKKKRDRFKGTTEEEVLQRVLPDHIKQGLDILIIGINPGLTAAYVGHHYAGPGNHFWKCLFLSGLIPHQMNAYDDHKLQDYGIGFTNIVARTSRGSADLTKKEIKEGGEILAEKVKKYKPKIAVFNGKGIYEVFCGHKNFHIGKQPENFPGCEETAVFVMPSSSARFTQLPRAIDKVPFYLALKKYRDHLHGKLPELKKEEIFFPDLNLKVVPKAERLAEIAKQEAESGQLFMTAEDKALMEGETKPKKGRKKKQQPNQDQCPPPNDLSTAVKTEPGESYSQQACTISMPQTNSQQAGTAQMTQNYSHPASTASLSSPPASVEDLLANGGTLVKQEDVSELVKYGIHPSQLSSQLSGQYSTSPILTSGSPASYSQTAQYTNPTAPSQPTICQTHTPTTNSQQYNPATTSAIGQLNMYGTMGTQWPGGLFHSQGVGPELSYSQPFQMQSAPVTGHYHPALSAPYVYPQPPGSALTQPPASSTAMSPSHVSQSSTVSPHTAHSQATSLPPQPTLTKQEPPAQPTAHPYWSNLPSH